MADEQGSEGNFRLYHYDPSTAANAVFVGLFALVTIAHAYILVRKKTWYFIPFLMGCICKFGSSLLL